MCHLMVSKGTAKWARISGRKGEKAFLSYRAVPPPNSTIAESSSFRRITLLFDPTTSIVLAHTKYFFYNKHKPIRMSLWFSIGHFISTVYKMISQSTILWNFVWKQCSHTRKAKWPCLWHSVYLHFGPCYLFGGACTLTLFRRKLINITWP